MNFFYPFKYFSYPAIVVSFLVPIPFYVTLKNLKKKKKEGRDTSINYILLFFLAGSYAYSIMEALVLSAPDPKTSLTLIRIFYMVIPFIMPMYVYLIFSYPSKIIQNPVINFFIFFFPAMILSILATTDLIIKGVVLADWGYDKVLGSAYPGFQAFWFLGYSLLIPITLYKITKFRSEPKIRNTVIHLFFAAIIPAIFNIMIVIILPQVFGLWLCHLLTPAYPLGYQALYITYIITRGHLLDFDVVVGPILKTQKYLFHKNMAQFMADLQYAENTKEIVSKLSSLLGCNIFLYININGMKYFISSEKNKANFPFTKFNISECDLKELEKEREDLGERSFENKKIANFLSEYKAEYIFPISGHKISGVVIFGENFSKKIYSQQDFRLIRSLCDSLKTIIFQNLRAQQKARKPLFILSNQGHINGVITEYHDYAKVLDLATFENREIPILDYNRCLNFLETIIDTSHAISKAIPCPIKNGDIVLIHYDKSPVIYAKVEKIESSVTNVDLFVVSLLLLVTPLKLVNWCLTSDNLNGSSFAVDGHSISIKILDDVQSTTSKVIPFNFRKKNKD